MGRQAEKVDESATAAENRAIAGEELTSIWELKESKAFQWFESEFIDRPFLLASEKLRGIIELEPNETLKQAQTTYRALREVKSAIIERELSWRRLLDANDPEIEKLQMKLGAL